MEAVEFNVDGDRLLGGFYRAGGGGRRPGVVLLHGIPGHERNLDLAQVLRASGLHCLYFHYRGSWGSEGDYRLGHLVPDARAAVDWLTQREDVDPARVALVGISLGGWVALAAAAEMSAPGAVCALSPLADPRQRPLAADEAADFARALHSTDAERLQREWLELRPLTTWAPKLGGIPVQLVTGDKDEFFPPAHYRPLIEALPRIRWDRFPHADHVFSSVRPGLCHVVRGFLLQIL